MGLRFLTNAHLHKRKSSVAAVMSCNQEDWTVLDKMREVIYTHILTCMRQDERENTCTRTYTYVSIFRVTYAV